MDPLDHDRLETLKIESDQHTSRMPAVHLGELPALKTLHLAVRIEKQKASFPSFESRRSMVLALQDDCTMIAFAHWVFQRTPVKDCWPLQKAAVCMQSWLSLTTQQDQWCRIDFFVSTEFHSIIPGSSKVAKSLFTVASRSLSMALSMCMSVVKAFLTWHLNDSTFDLLNGRPRSWPFWQILSLESWDTMTGISVEYKLNSACTCRMLMH